MKKSMKKLLSLVMVIAALAALTVPALAADAVVSRQGTNGLVIETTGSGYTDTDLFGNFKNVMPGDELTENITIQNNVSGFDYVKLYIRAEAHDEEGNPLTYSEPFENEDGHDQANIDGERDETVVTMADFLSKLTMEVYLVNADGTKQSIFSASPDETAQLTDNVLLGTFAKGKSAKLEAVLTVPAELGNEYAYRVGEVDWVFTVEGFNNEKPLIPTGQLNWPVAATWSFPAMEISPCRHTGSVYNDNLVVAGHNYKTEFDVLFHLEAGDTVTFTDVDGNVFTYTVREFASVTPDDSDTVMNSGYALTMYTCNWDTSERVTVFCERTGGEIPGENA